MPGFTFEATVVRVIDGDTILVDPMIYPQDQNLRVRFKDAFAPERNEAGWNEAKDNAKVIFPTGITVVLTNTRSKWTYNRLEARVDPKL